MGTLYDVLQVSSEAEPEIIRAAYERLSAAVHGHDDIAEIRRKVLDEAFLTLANPEQRARYDQRLARQAPVIIEEAEPRSLAKTIVLTVVLCAGIFGYVKYNQSQENARLERERIAAEQRKAELAAQQESEQRRDEADQRRAETERLRAEQQQRLAFERTRREADMTMRNNAAADERIRRDEERRRQDADRQVQQARLNEERDAQRRLEREKALARQLEAENSRTRRIY